MSRHALPIAALALIALLASCATSARAKELCAEYYAIAEGYSGLSKYDKAIEYYGKAARSQDLANASNYGIGRMYALSGDWARAKQAFGALYDKDRENGIVAYAYAYSLAASGEAEKALALYKALYDKDPENVAYARDYAEILVIAGKYEEGLAQIALIRSKFPDTDAVKDIDNLEKKAKEGLNPPEKKPEAKATTDGKALPNAKDAPAPPATGPADQAKKPQ